MVRTIEAEQTSRSLAEFLREARRDGAEFVIVENGREVARLIPTEGPSTLRRSTFGDLVALFEKHGHEDPTFANDLEIIQADQSVVGEGPWGS